ncbi:hypothetical protein [Spirillospora albida]|uniref:hypothetical protein n=1 Tax=Spirillospora albida TaxID=58123 RepID=UPI0004BF790C|nr:hypothetical protein [Spirillospora albida]
MTSPACAVTLALGLLTAAGTATFADGPSHRAVPKAPTVSGAPTVTKYTNIAVLFAPAPGDRSAASFQCRLDDGPYHHCTSPYRARDLAEGRHTLSVRGVNAHGTPGAAHTDSWTVDRTNPDQPWVTDPRPVGEDQVVVRIRGERGASFRCKLDRTAYRACGSSLHLRKLPRRTHTLRVYQIDAAGNEGPSAAVRWRPVR